MKKTKTIKEVNMNENKLKASGGLNV